MRPRRDRRVILHSLDFDDTATIDLENLQYEQPGWIEYVKGVAAVIAKENPADLDALYACAYGNGKTVLGGGVDAYTMRLDLRAVYQFYCSNHPLPSEPQYPLWQGLPADSSLSRAELERQVWGETLPDSDTLRSHLYNLRRIIDKPFGAALLLTGAAVAQTLGGEIGVGA